jgi:lysophospholipase L1-like esterase
MGKAKLKQFLLAVLVVVVILLILEGSARIIEWQLVSMTSSLPDRPGWQTEFFGSLFEWHEPDPDLLWRFKAGLSNPLITTNSDHFLGPEISRGKPADTYRVLILGDSSPVGLGLQSSKKTFAEILRHLLDRRFESRKDVEIINAAVSGYSSDQVLCWLESRGWAYDPDLVVVYCGNNDASISGSFTDQELLAGQKLKALRKLCSHLAIYRLMKCFLQPQSDKTNVNQATLAVRVSPGQFGINLATIAARGREHDCPVVVLKPPVPLLWPAGLQFKPFLHLTGRNGKVILPEEMAAFLGRDIVYCIDSTQFREIYGEADIFTREVYRTALEDSLSVEFALERYRSKSVKEPDNPIWFNNFGATLWKMGKYREADSILQVALGKFFKKHGDNTPPAITACASPILYNLGINKLFMDPSQDIFNIDSAGEAYLFLNWAREADYFSLRIKQSYCQEIDQLPRGSGLAVIDLPTIFCAEDGERLFIDHCHPTAEGHLIIARAVFDTILARRW